MNLDELIENFIDDVEMGDDEPAIAGAKEIIKMLDVVGSPNSRSIDSDALSFLVGTLLEYLEKNG